MVKKCVLAVAAALGLVAVDASEANAWFQFTNSTSKSVLVVFQWHSPSGCAESGSWETAGWWQLAPGETKVVYGDDLQASSSSNFYYYAETDDQVTAWSGPFQTCVPATSFNWCLHGCNSEPDTRVLGFREVDVGSANNYTVEIVSPACASSAPATRAVGLCEGSVEWADARGFGLPPSPAASKAPVGAAARCSSRRSMAARRSSPPRRGRRSGARPQAPRC